MALILNRVFETTTTSGTGTLDLDGAVTSYEAFVDRATADYGAGPWSVWYLIEDDNDYEIGVGTLTSGTPDTLSRDTVYASSNGDAAVSWGANTKNVFCWPSGGAVNVSGKQTIWVPAEAMTPTGSNGCAVLAQTVLGGSPAIDYPEINSLDFDASADEHAQFRIAMPKGWDEGTITFKFFWSPSAAVSTGVAMGLRAVSLSDDDSMVTAFGTPQVVTDDAGGTANDIMISAESSAITVAGSPAAGDIVCFDLYRDVSDANDDMTQDLRLLGIQIFFTTDAGTDD